jgi:hypothetical protein
VANEVYANGMEVSCKAAGGKSICAFPDVCFTPPTTPATPPGVPIPYPNTGLASDCTDGSSTVKISGQEVMLKNKSYFKRSTGDEAGSAPKKGVVTSKNMGKVYFTMWSMDVKIEGENVVRNFDLTTHNHASTPGNSPPWCYTDNMTQAQLDDCAGDMANEKAACSGADGNYESADKCCKNKKCQEARACMLVPYGGSGSPNCCEGRTGHHLLPNSLLQGTRGQSSSNVDGLKKTGPNAYNVNDGACVCAVGESFNAAEHKSLHDKTKDKLRGILEAGEDLDYKTAKQKVTEAHSETYTDSKGKPRCNPKCIEAQLDASLQPHSTGSEIDVRQKDGMTRKNFDRYKDGAKD